MHIVHIYYTYKPCDISHVSATHVLHLYFNTCNTRKIPQCITGVAQLAMYVETHLGQYDMGDACLCIFWNIVSTLQKHD